MTTDTPSANAQVLYEILAPHATDHNFAFRNKHGHSLPKSTALYIIDSLHKAGFTWDTLFQLDQSIYSYLPYEQAGTIHWILRRLRNHFSKHINNP